MILSKNTYPETRKCVSGYFSGSFAHTTPKRSENYGRKQAGAVELPFAPAAVITAWASVAGKKESQGPLGHCFDKTSQDTFFGQKTWEQAEKAMQEQALSLLLKRQRSSGLIWIWYSPETC